MSVLSLLVLPIQVSECKTFNATNKRAHIVQFKGLSITMRMYFVNSSQAAKKERQLENLMPAAFMSAAGATAGSETLLEVCQQSLHAAKHTKQSAACIPRTKRARFRR